MKEKKRIIILGIGDIGQYLINVLSHDGYNIIAIDMNKEKMEQLTEKKDISVIIGNGVDIKIYEQLNLQPNDVFIAVTYREHVNLLACYFAKSFGCNTNIVRVEHASLSLLDGAALLKKMPLLWKNLGVDVLFNQTEITINEIERLVENLGAEEIVYIHENALELAGYRIKENSLLCNRIIMGLDSVPSFQGIIIPAIIPSKSKQNKAIQKKRELKSSVLRFNKKKDAPAPEDIDDYDDYEFTIIPDKNYKMQEGDLMFLCGKPSKLKNIGRIFDPNFTFADKHIFIFGESYLTVEIAKKLSKKYPNRSIYLIVKTKSIAYSYRERLSNRINIILGNIHSIDTLIEEGIDERCVFIGASSDEDENILACSLVKEETSARTIAVIEKPTSKHLVKYLEIDAAVSTKQLMADYVLNTLQKEFFYVISTKGKDTELIEFSIDPRSQVVHQEIRHLLFPKGSIIVAIFRKNGTLIIPQGKNKILSGDKVIIFALKKVIPELKKLFSEIDIKDTFS